MYFDYSASTPINTKARNAYLDASQLLIGNFQSKHALGDKSKRQILDDKNKFKSLLNLNKHHLSFTQNASEANQKILNHILDTPETMHVITSPFEHSSITKILFHKQKQGLSIDVLDTDELGNIDLNHLQELITPKTTLVIVSLVDSELGILQDIKQIHQYIKNARMMVDITQAIGKVEIDLKYVDYLSFSAHKFYGPKGLGGIFHLEKNDTFQTGTQSESLIHSSRVALEETLAQDHSNVLTLNTILIEALKDEPHVFINNTQGIPHLINLSIQTESIPNLVDFFSQHNIYLSQGSACQNLNYSPNVYRLTQSLSRAKSSIRISLSHLTTEAEVKTLIETIKEVKNL